MNYSGHTTDKYNTEIRFTKNIDLDMDKTNLKEAGYIEIEERLD